uniref:Large ribosomal subunit protein uL24c n=1 Tax=Rhizochromulina marina TaxID=1034831 RepID=A0A514CPV1_9STRA|nr:ribosomal protein L24 [Rhizochromulina marina]QDH81830.1 ribosomal protein L24 [Rhizochromulina marina]
MKNLKIGDRVKVISGQEKGKITKIKSLIRKKGKVVLENTNTRIKHTKPAKTNEAGKIIQFEAPIDASNVMICNEDGIVSRIELSFENGKKQRRAKKPNVKL